jgi:hypothetical protein
VKSSMACADETRRGVPRRHGTTIELTALRSDANRLTRLTALRQLESGLATDGWVRVVWPSQCAAELYDAGTQLLADAPACLAYRRDALLAADTPQPLGLTYLDLGDEPLYDAASGQQRVRSLNMHEQLSVAECDERLPPSYSGEERRLAYEYHAWPDDGPSASLRHAADMLRRQLLESVGVPLLRAFAALLGVDEGTLLARCEGRRSDNTSMLRMLEYPQTHPVPGDRDAHRQVWGVSEHTDFEVRFASCHTAVPSATLRALHTDHVCIDLPDRSSACSISRAQACRFAIRAASGTSPRSCWPTVAWRSMQTQVGGGRTTRGLCSWVICSKCCREGTGSPRRIACHPRHQMPLCPGAPLSSSSRSTRRRRSQQSRRK